MDAKLTWKTVDWMNQALNRADASNDVITKGDKYVRTPWELCEEIVGQIAAQSPLQGKKILVVDTVEFIPVLLAFGAEKCNITYVAPYEYKGAMIAGVIGVRVVQQSLLDWRPDMKTEPPKFDVVVGNPPFQITAGKSKVSVGTKLIKKFFEYVEDAGFYAMISASNFLGGGQLGLGYMFTENKTNKLNINLKNYFPKVGIDVGYFILEKIPAPDSQIIEMENKGSNFTLDPADFIYNGNRPYIPKNVCGSSLPILKKIISYNKDVFAFRSSESKGMQNKVGFWAGANTGIHPKYIKLTTNGEFDSKWVDHPCGLDKTYPEENIKAIFAGKLFHWVLFVINGHQSDRRPANLSYFPKVDLSRKWTFDDLAEEFKLTDDEKKVITDWALTRGKTEWFD